MNSIYKIIVKTNQRKESVNIVDGTLDTILVKTKAMPIEGKANEAVIAAIASYLGVPKRNVTLKSGVHSKTKIVSVETE